MRQLSPATYIATKTPVKFSIKKPFGLSGFSFFSIFLEAHISKLAVPDVDFDRIVGFSNFLKLSFHKFKAAGCACVKKKIMASNLTKTKIDELR